MQLSSLYVSVMVNAQSKMDMGLETAVHSSTDAPVRAAGYTNTIGFDKLSACLSLTRGPNDKQRTVVYIRQHGG